MNNFLSNEHKAEIGSPQTISYDRYTLLCNQDSKSSRRAGILDEEVYSKVLEDPRTVYLDFSDEKVPCIAHIEYGGGLGYDTSRCVNKATDNQDSIFVWMLSSLSTSDLQHSPQLRESLENSLRSFEGTIYFSDDVQKTLEKSLTDIFSHLSVPTNINRLTDPKAPIGHQNPTLSLYQMNTIPTNNTAKSRRLFIEDFLRFNNLGYKEGVGIQRGSSLSMDMVYAMWDLYEKRFSWLGENHPISMEDNFADFVSLISHDQCLVFYKKDSSNSLKCFTYIQFDTQALYWLNQHFLLGIKESSDTEQTMLFFPGIVSSIEGAGHSYDVLKTIAEIGDRLNMRGIVLFEDTNISEIYVPDIVRNSLNSREHPNIISGEEGVLDKTSYAAIEVARH